jgi:threonylcarbamoyladenosine tRNA methylthiotransferase MtaB
MFANTLAFVDEAGLDYLHVFPFSARAGTPAARMPQVAGPVVRERAARLREKGAAAFARSLSARVGSTLSVLVERDGFGYSEHYAPVRVSPFRHTPVHRGGEGGGLVAPIAGDIVEVRVTGATADTLIGEAA